MEKRWIRRSVELALFCGLLAAAPAGGADPYDVLPLKKIAEQKLKSCALIHVWATWCVPCIDELPKFLAFAASHRKVTPIVIDVSNPYVQDQFSKKWMKQLKPPFTTYLKPGGNEKAYYKAIDEKWPDRLPYNALYDGGKQRGRWIGTLDFKKLDADITRFCK